MTIPQRLSTCTLLLVVTTFLSLASAQQGVLTSGNTQLPACAQQCPKLMQAAQACSGTTSATTSVWNCFCQSGYLTTLYTSPTGICDTSTCTDATDNQNIMNWYKSNCGTDNGASEHANAAAPSGTTTTAPASASTSAAPTVSKSALPSTGTTNTNQGVDPNSNSQKPWIDTHYQWIIFVVVVVVGFSLISVLAVWYKRRYYRRRDQINGGFNAGVSDQVPPMRNSVYNNSGNLAGPGSIAAPSGPARDGARIA